MNLCHESYDTLGAGYNLVICVKTTNILVVKNKSIEYWWWTPEKNIFTRPYSNEEFWHIQFVPSRICVKIIVTGVRGNWGFCWKWSHFGDHHPPLSSLGTHCHTFAIIQDPGFSCQRMDVPMDVFLIFLKKYVILILPLSFKFNNFCRSGRTPVFSFIISFKSWILCEANNPVNLISWPLHFTTTSETAAILVLHH